MKNVDETIEKWKQNKKKVKPDFVSKAAKGKNIETIDPDKIPDTKNYVNPIEPQLTLKTEIELNKRNIKFDSPSFNSLGANFAQKYDRLQKLKGVNKSHANHDKSEIIEIDDYLFAEIQKHFAPVGTNENEGKIKEIIETIAVSQKLNKTQAGLMLKSIGSEMVFFGTGQQNNPIIEGKGPLMYSFADVKGKSRILNTGNIMNVYRRLMDLLNLKENSFCFLFKINAQENVFVQLFVNGNMEVKFGFKSINDWLIN